MLTNITPSLDLSIKLLKCQTCSHVTTNFPEPISHWKHCYKCICSNHECNEYWYICPEHHKRFARSKIHRLYDHFTNIDHSHLDTNEDVPIDSKNDESINSFTKAIVLLDSNTTSTPCAHMSKKSKLTHDYTKESNLLTYPESLLPSLSKRFFDDDIVQPGFGQCGLVTRAFSQNNESTIVANNKESNLHLNITHFCSTLSQSQQNDFASIISCIMSKDMFSSTRPPISYNDITKYYMNSQYSVFRNIPCPSVFEIEDHACVSIENIINHMLAFGIELNEINLNKQFDQLNSRTNSIENTREFENIIEKIKTQESNVTKLKPIIIYIMIWSDDLKANHTRKNRNSTWIKTVTICPPRSDTTSPLYTYPIAMGRKGQCHDKVNEFFNKELQTLSKCTLRYSSKLQKMYPVIVRPPCVLADRPERSSLNCILSHNGCSTKRWSFSELIPRTKLPSCEKCFYKRIEKLIEGNLKKKKPSTCNRCCDWEMSKERKVSHFFPPTNYPSKKHPDSPPPPIGRDVSQPFVKLPPIRVTYEILYSATKFAFWNYLHSYWNKSQTQIYFRLVGISTSYFTTVLDYADQQKKYLPVSANILESIPFPSMWNSIFRLEQSIDTPMHLLFQGITKAIIEESKEFLKYHKLWSSFGRQCNIVMDDISSAHVSFCKIECFNGGAEYTTGGWIAETYLGFGRICCILYALVTDLLPPTSLGLNEFQCVIQSLFCLLSRLMTDLDIGTEEITDYVKIFLSFCQRYYTQLYGDSNNKNPFWNSPNCLSLLNLPTQIEQFGSMRLYWEGVNERYIQFVKPYLKNMRSSTSFFITKLSQMHKTNVLKNHLITPLNNKKSYDRFKDYKKYKDLSYIEELLNATKPVMGIIYKLNNTMEGIGLLINNPTKIVIITLKFNDSLGYRLNNLWYTPISVYEKIEFESNEIDNYVQDYFLAVPLKIFDDKITRYTITTKKWMIRNSDGKFRLPTISKHNIQTSDSLGNVYI